MKSFKDYISEMAPYMSDESPSVLGNSFPSISDNRIERELEFLFKVNNIDVYKDTSARSELRLIGVEDHKTKLWNGERYRIVLRLFATHKVSSYMLRGDKTIQIKNVEIVDERKSEGSVSLIYTKLVEMGYNVVSDRIQLVGGVELWKSLIRIHLTKYDIKVWNAKSKSYIGIPGIDVPLDVIWTSKDNTSGKNLLLVMTKKGN